MIFQYGPTDWIIQVVIIRSFAVEVFYLEARSELLRQVEEDRLYIQIQAQRSISHLVGFTDFSNEWPRYPVIPSAVVENGAGHGAIIACSQ